MKALFYMLKYIRKNWKLWVCGIFVPAFFSMATNIYFSERLKNYVMMITEHHTPFEEIFKMLIATLFVLILLSCIDNLGIFVLSLFLASTENELRYDFYNSLVRTPLKTCKNSARVNSLHDITRTLSRVLKLFLMIFSE